MVDKFDGLMQLPIRRRGDFGTDDFFKDFHKEFDFAVKDVMNRHTGRSLLADQFSNYRKLKKQSSQDTGPAASISETNEACVIVLDMSEFVQGSISVRTRGHYAIVDASHSGKTSFSRRFPLPRNTDLDGLKTAMSNEGILTITAPKKGVSTSGRPSTTTETEGDKKGSESCLKIDTGEPESRSEGKEGEREEGQAGPPSTSTSEAGQGGGEGGENVEEKDRVFSISRKGNFFEDEYFGNVWKDFESAMGEMVHKEERKKAEKEKSKAEREELVNTVKRDMALEAERRRKTFFGGASPQAEKEQDSGLSSAPFGAASPPPQHFSRLNSYRNLRTWDPNADTQAVTITQDNNGYKIVMDVKNCGKEEGDVSVKATEGSLSVTGRRGSWTFKKEFSLKGLTDPSQVSASVSEDGILTITAAV